MSSPVAKLLVYILGAVATVIGQAVTLGLLSGTAKLWASLAAGFVTLVGTGIGIYFVPNTPPAAKSA